MIIVSLILEELKKRGIEAVEEEIEKNGVKLQALRIKTDSNIQPVIYLKKLLEECETLEELTDKIEESVKYAMKSSPDVSKIFSKDNFVENVYIGLQRAGSQPLVKRDTDMEGIESYLYVRRQKSDMEAFETVKVTQELLSYIGITENEAWETAEKNTFKETEILSMADVMAKIMPGFVADEEIPCGPQMYVVSNSSGFRGASAVLNKAALKELAEKIGSNRLVILPSSVHECMVIPFSEDLDLEETAGMVKEINEAQVDPVEQLSDRAYLIEL